MASAPIANLIPGRLAWAPEQLPGCVSGCRTVSALDLCLHGAVTGSAAGTYEVRHYPKGTYGLAFGPLGLESLMRFCRGLAARVEGSQPGGSALALVTPAGNKNDRANAAVLLGSYLVLGHGWSAARLAAHLGKEDAGAKFACSWGRKDRSETERVMQVRDCWAGIELAKKQAWIDARFIEDDAKMEAACSKYDGQLTLFDTTWIIPGMLMVGADPVTTVSDPNPATFSQIFPQDDDVQSSSSFSTEVPGEDGSDTDSISSLNTVCKEYTTNFVNGSAKGEGMDKKQEGQDFTSFLRQSGVGIVIRANFNDETGMPGKGSYSDRAFEAYGLAQANIRVVDTGGGLPRPSDVARMLEACEGFMEQRGEEAVLVHCKGGFGRSVILACCLAISRLDVPGAALLGWVRVARPGAVTTRAQELFLASLKGRKDVLRYAKVRIVEGHRGGVSLSCRNPCQIQ